jgi:hypothetical protein
MRQRIRILTSSFFLAGMLLLSVRAGAQQKAQQLPQRNQAYDIARETLLEGTVLKYTEASSVPPLGAHVTLHTATGPVDIHLGNARLLAANHFSLNPGDTVRVMGESLAYGQGLQFVARVVQKGGQTLMVRSVRGIPLLPAAPRTGGAGASAQQGGVL